MQVDKPEVWKAAAWQPAFVKIVHSYQALVHYTHSADEVQASVSDALCSLSALNGVSGLLGSLFLVLAWMIFY